MSKKMRFSAIILAIIMLVRYSEAGLLAFCYTHNAQLIFS